MGPFTTPVMFRSGTKRSDHKKKKQAKHGARPFARYCAAVFGFFMALATPALALPDWAVSMNDTGSEGLPAGGTIVYNLNIRNQSFDDPAGQTTITFDVQAGTTMVGGTGPLTNCVGFGVAGPTTVTCDVPALGTDTAIEYMAEVQTTVAGSVSLTATIPDAGDENPGTNNTATETTTVVAGADIGLTVAGPTSSASGSVVDYTFTATNNGPNDSDGFEIMIPKPVGLENIVTPPGCTFDGTSYSCLIPGTVAVGDMVDVTLTGQISASENSTVSVQASVGGGTPLDGVSDNNTVLIDTSVTGGSDVSISKSISDSSLLVGETATFTLTSQFSGDSPSGLRILDTIPGNYSVVSIDTGGTGWDCSASSGNAIDCSLASAPGGGANVSLGSILIEVSVDSSGNPQNTASISSDSPVDPVPGNNSDDDGGVLIEDPTVDHQATKSGPSPNLVAVGSEYDYTIGSTNLGNAGFVGTLVMDDQIPAGMTLTALDQNGWTCTPAPPPDQVGPVTLHCELVYPANAPLASGASAPGVTTTLLVTQTGTLNNTMTVSTVGANIEDNDLSNNTITFGSSGQQGDLSPDVEVTKSASLATLPSGEQQTFTIEVLNNGPVNPGMGPIDAEGVVLTDRLNNLINNTTGPNGGLVSVSINAAGMAAGMTCSTATAGARAVDLTCNIAALPECSAGSCPVVTVVVRPGGNAGTQTNTADVITTITADSDPNNNTASASYDITARADVTVSKTATPSPATVGQNLEYLITAENRPTDSEAPPNNQVLSTAQNVVITDTLPADMTFVSATPSGGSCSVTPTAETTTQAASNNTVVCELGNIVNNGQRTVLIVVRPNNELIGDTVTNAVSVTTDTPESDAGNNSFSLDTPILAPEFDLLVNKTADEDPIAVGDDVVYSVVVTNLGPSAAENVVMVDNMPPNRVGFQSFTAPAGTSCVNDAGTGAPVNAGSGPLGVEVTCTIPYLEAGASETFLITGRGDSKGTSPNSANVTADFANVHESNTGNNSASVNTTVRSRVDIRVNSKTPSSAVVNLGDDFSYTIEIENIDNSGLLFGPADDVVLTDNLPSNMILTGTPTSADGTCTGAFGDTGFTCDFGTMSIGQISNITVPVRAVSVSSEPQRFTNSASVETSSRDVEESNDSNSGFVDVNSSSISGRVFRDFNDDGAITPGADTGVSGVRMFLTGTDSNGNAVSEFVDVNADGTYAFNFLPEGTYTVRRGTVSEDYVTDGTNTAGTGGPTFTTLESPSITLGDNADEPDYNFAVVPQARIGLAKRVFLGPTLNADGTFAVRFRLTVENFSLEALNDISLTDTLSGGEPLFGTFVASSVSPMPRGSYTIQLAPTGTCSGTNAGFTGTGGNLEVLSGATLAAESTCTVDFTVRANPTDPFPSEQPGGAEYLNSANVTGTGALSGQTSATNPLLADVSDDGSNADANGDGSGDDAGEDTPTPVSVEFSSSMELDKAVDTSALSSPPQAGEVLSYTYTVRNTGSFNLFDISVTDVAANFTGTGTPVPTPGAPSGGADIDGDGDLPDLAPGSAVITYSASYTLTQEDINTGFVRNTAQVAATDVYGAPIGDISDDPADGNNNDTEGDGDPDDPTVATLTRTPRLSVVKSITAESFSTPIAAGDTISYQFVVTNSGNVDIDAVTPVDPGPAFNGVPGTGAALSFATSDDTNLSPTEIATFTATYTLTAADVANLRTAADPSDAIVNVADASGTVPAGTTLNTDTSSTETGITPMPGITLVKAISDVQDTNMNAVLGDAGDTIVYTLTATNAGDTSLGNVRINDAKLGLSNAAVTPADLAPGASGVLANQNYTITLQDQAAREVENTATALGTPVATNADGTPNPGTPLTDSAGTPLADEQDVSDTLTEPDLDADGNVVATPDPAADGDDTPTLLNLPPTGPEITLVKAITEVRDENGNGQFGDVGDTVIYTLTVSNTGNSSLADITITDSKLNLTNEPIVPDDLAPGESGVLSNQSYTITPLDQANGQVENTATTSGQPVQTNPDGTPDPGTPLLDDMGNPIDPVVDTSDTLTEPDLNPDGTVVATPDPAADGDDNPTLVNLPVIAPEITLVKAISDVTDVNNNGLFGDVGDIITYTLTVTNTGNTSLADVTITDSKLSLTDVPVVPGDLAPMQSGTLSGITYEITPTDQAAREVVNTATTSGTAVATASDGTPDSATPLVDDTGAPLDPVSDTSDTSTTPDLDSDGNPVTTADPAADGDDNPTRLNLPATGPEITLTKAITEVQDVNNNGLFGDIGDIVVYEIIVRNTGNTSLASVTVTDALLGLNTVSPTPDALAQGESATLSGLTYEITALDQGAGMVENTASTSSTAVATAPDGTPDASTPLLADDGSQLPPVTDTSDTLTEPDLAADGSPLPTSDPGADGNESPTLLNLPEVNAEITLVKVVSDVADINGNGLFGDVGDVITYDLTATNTGNTALSGVTITDAKLSLTDVPVTPGDLAPGDAGVLSGLTYTVTAQDQAEGRVENTATTSGTAVATAPDGTPDTSTPLLDDTGAPLPPVTDTSDTGTDPTLDSDGNPVPTADPAADGEDTPTSVNLPATEPEITLVKRITDVTDSNANGLFGDIGDVISYEMTITNTGNTALAGVTLTDAKLSLSDVPVSPADLAPGDQAVITGLSYEITAADLGVGVVENTATTSGTAVATAPDGSPDPTTPLLNDDGSPRDPVTDVSDTGTAPDLDADGNVVPVADPSADGEDTPTLLNLPVVDAQITLVKAITDVEDTNGNGLFGDVGDVVSYGLTVTNTGNISLAGVTVSDAKLELTEVPVSPADLAPGEMAEVTGLTYVITPQDQAAGQVENTATTSGTAVATGPDGRPAADTPLLGPDGAPLPPVEDVSDTSTDPELDADGNPVSTADPAADGEDTPTVLTLPNVEPQITLVKSVASVVDTNDDQVLGNAGDTITYTFVATNTGNTALSDVSITDALLEMVNVPTTPTALAPGESASLSADLLITPEIFATGSVENTATAFGTPVATGPDGTPDADTPLVGPEGNPLPPLEDLSDAGTEAVANEDGTLVPIDDPANTGTGEDTTVLELPLVPSDYFVSGTVYLDTNRDGVLDAEDDPTEGAGYTVQLVDMDGNVIDQVIADSEGNYEMSGFPAGEYVVQFVDPLGMVAGESEALVFSEDQPSYEEVNLPLVLSDGASIDSLTISKVVANGIMDVRIGDVVPYRIVVSNSNDRLVGPARVVDRLPPGLSFVPGSAQIDGVAVTPQQAGPNVIFEELFVSGNASSTITLSAVVGAAAPSGNLVNQATLFDGITGDVIAPVAEAIVRRLPEHVFDCSDVIGKVFDDRNGNGYQDGLVSDGAITDQSYDGGKGKVARAPAAPEAEPGLAGVRIATVKGTLITTDEFGRFHVPCAELPSSIGSNFILKVDERSLPSGYRMTTENPRVVRLTAGKMAKMNFGASLSRVVDIALSERAFGSGAEVSERLAEAVRNLARTLQQEPSVVRLSYVAGSAAEVRLGRARMRAVEQVLRREWRRQGTYKLVIEKTIHRRQ